MRAITGFTKLLKTFWKPQNVGDKRSHLISMPLEEEKNGHFRKLETSDVKEKD